MCSYGAHSSRKYVTSKNGGTIQKLKQNKVMWLNKMTWDFLPYYL